MFFSFVTLTGISGISFGHGNTLVNLIQRKNMILDYIGIVYSGNPTTDYFIRLVDDGGQDVTPRITLPRLSDVLTDKRLYEVEFEGGGFKTDVSRHLQLQLFVDPPFNRAILYAITIGFREN